MQHITATVLFWQFSLGVEFVSYISYSLRLWAWKGEVYEPNQFFRRLGLAGSPLRRTLKRPIAILVTGFLHISMEIRPIICHSADFTRLTVSARDRLPKYPEKQSSGRAPNGTYEDTIIVLDRYNWYPQCAPPTKKYTFCAQERSIYQKQDFR